MGAEAARFTGSIPEHYDRHLGPVIFDPYAEDLVRRVPLRDGIEVLETACGTGRVTRRLLERLPRRGRLVATDLNEAMLEYAQRKLPGDPRIEWRAADATALPFADASFDAVVCQFGVMFYPDKDAGAREARRVLRPGGTYLLNVWDDFAHNAFGRVAHQTIAGFFPTDPPAFYLTPFGYSDPAAIRDSLERAGFREVAIEHVDREAKSVSARELAIGAVRGNPVSTMIEERGTVSLDQVIEAVSQAFAREGGEAPFRSPIRALVVTARA
jgi:ubiquinone/menaquinone biosynthesis C-methylase UbiE